MFLVVSEVQGGQNRVRHVQIHPWEASIAPGADLQSSYRHKITQVRYKGLKRTKKTKKFKEKQMKTKENLRYQGTQVSPSMFQVLPGVDLDMPDSILTSLDLKNHQKHPKQKKPTQQK